MTSDALFDFASWPRTFWLIPILVYLAAGLSQIAPWLLAPDGSVTDQADAVWRIRDLHATAVLVALLTMLPTSLLAMNRLWRDIGHFENFGRFRV